MAQPGDSIENFNPDRGLIHKLWMTDRDWAHFKANRKQATALCGFVFNAPGQRPATATEADRMQRCTACDVLGTTVDILTAAEAAA